jgi:hypothetical protein
MDVSDLHGAHCGTDCAWNVFPYFIPSQGVLQTVLQGTIAWEMFFILWISRSLFLGLLQVLCTCFLVNSAASGYLRSCCGWRNVGTRRKKEPRRAGTDLLFYPLLTGNFQMFDFS